MKYLTPELEVIKFEVSDVLATSTSETTTKGDWETDQVPFGL